MRRVMVRYRVKPELVMEHEELARAIFDELSLETPTGLRYGAYRQADGVSFVHFAVIDADKNPLESNDAFKAFSERIKDRCDEPPVVTELTEVGAYEL